MADVSRRQSFGHFGALSAGPLIASAATACTARPDQAGTSANGVSVLEFGAVGDGVHDDTAAFQKALADVPVVIVPPTAKHYRISRTLRLARPGQRVVGSGPLSRIVQSGSGSNSTIFVSEFDDTGFLALGLSPGGSVGDLSEGWAIVIAGARGCVVRDCHMSLMRRGGVMLWDAQECVIAANRLTDSLVLGDGSEPQSRMGYDIYLAGKSSRNIVIANHCLSGVGTGIGCQTATSGKSQFDNLIAENVIARQPCYGIMCYLSDPGDRIDRLSIQANIISEISGAVYSDGATRFYGCGIYVQTSNDFLIEGNRIRNTNTDRTRPFSGSAVPAAIGISGCGNGVVQGNLIDGCFDGITSIQTTERPRPGDGTIIAGNIVRRCDRTAILLADCVAAQVTGNRLSTLKSGAEAIRVQQVAVDWVGAFTIAHNHIHGFDAGIATLGSPIAMATLIGNHVSGNGGNGIHLTAETVLVQQNHIDGENGISLSPLVRRGICSDNVIRYRGTALLDGTDGACLVERNLTLKIDE